MFRRRIAATGLAWRADSNSTTCAVRQWHITVLEADQLAVRDESGRREYGVAANAMCRGSRCQIGPYLRTRWTYFDVCRIPHGHSREMASL
jgi:hypothetical protein